MLGIIGVGNMGGAILGVILDSGLLEAKDIMIYNHSREKAKKFIDRGVLFAANEEDLVSKCETLLLCVKPQSFDALARTLKGKIAEDRLIASIAAGISLEKLEELFGAHRFVRIMPNTPALIGQGMSALCKNDLATDADLDAITKLFDAVGATAHLPEEKFDAFSGIAGCMPAYVYMFIEAAADAAVKNGLKRDEAYKYVATAVAGSANMVLKTGKHPGELKDQVTSPGGTTIRGVVALEREGFRNAVIKAVDESTNFKIEVK